MRISAPIFRLKREARLRSRALGIPMHYALDQVAGEQGFKSWSHLSFSESQDHISKILINLEAGDIVLLGARPGQGKTLLALQLLMGAGKSGRPSLFFTLEYTELDILNRIRELGFKPENFDQLVQVDTSDKINAEHICECLTCADEASFVVIDYLQLLDQRRDLPELDVQVRQLAGVAKKTGSIIVVISQIHRNFDFGSKTMPELADVRLPNPVDLRFFSKTCFIHEGQLEFSEIA